MPEWSLSNTYFSIRHIRASLHLGTQDDFSALHVGAILNSKISNSRHKNAEKVALNRLKRHLFEVGELRQEGRRSPCSTSAGNAHMGTSHFPPPWARPGVGVAGLQVLLWRLQTWAGGRLASMEFENNEDWLGLFIHTANASQVKGKCIWGAV